VIASDALITRARAARDFLPEGALKRFRMKVFLRYM